MVTLEMAGGPFQSPPPLSLTHLSPTTCQKYISSIIQANAPQHRIVCNLQHPSTITHVVLHGIAIDGKCFPPSASMIFTDPPIHSAPSLLLSHNPDCQWNAQLHCDPTRPNLVHSLGKQQPTGSSTFKSNWLQTTTTHYTTPQQYTRKQNKNYDPISLSHLPVNTTATIPQSPQTSVNDVSILYGANLTASKIWLPACYNSPCQCIVHTTPFTVTSKTATSHGPYRV